MPALMADFAGAIAVSGPGSADIQSSAVTNDASGNVYITGSLRGTADFDPSAGVFNLTSTGGRDPFLAKYSNTGALIWAETIRGANSSSSGQSLAMAVDGSGNVFVTGTFNGGFNFDTSSGNTSLTATSRNDAFAAKYSSSGSLLWATRIVGTSGSLDQGNAVAVDSLGNVAVGGTFQGTATFGGSAIIAGGSSESFVTELDTNGQFLWARATQGSTSTAAQTSGLAFDPSNNLLVTGFYAGAVDFDPTAGVQQSPASGSLGLFVQKYGPSGTLGWTRFVSSAGVARGNGVTADSLGNLYIAGTFSQTATFGAGIGVVGFTAGGSMDALLLKVSSAGQYLWARDLSTADTNTAQGAGVALDNAGHVFIAGSYQGTLTSALGQSLTSAGASDAFVAEYDTSGTYTAAQGYGGGGADSVVGIGVNASGKIALAGSYSGPAGFGSATLPSQTGKSIFVAQISSNGTSLPPAPGAPSAPALQASSDSGSSQSDNITNAPNPVFNIAAAVANNTVKLLRDGVIVGTRTGPGAITDPGPIISGNHVYTAIQVDGFSQASPASSSATVTFDMTAPPAPAPPALFSADDSGTVGDGITNVKQPRFIGTAQPGSTVQILNASNVVVASGAADPSSGAFSLKASSNLADGVYNVRAQATDIAGNISAVSSIYTLTVDTVIPATLNAPALFADDDSGNAGDNLTNVTQPRLFGTVSGASSVQLLNASGTVIGTGSVSGNSYTAALASALPEGLSSLRVQAMDAAGNLSAPSSALNLTIDTKAPATPAAPTLFTADDSGTLGDGITNVIQPRFTGTAEPFATVRLTSSNAVIGTVTAGSDGSYSVKPVSPITNLISAIRVQAVDAAGNASAASPVLTLYVDTLAPSAPSTPALLASDDTGTPGDGITSVTQPSLTGTAEANSTVRLLDANGNVIGAGVAASSRNYSVKLNTPLLDGVYTIRAQATDAAGNISAQSAGFSLTVAAVSVPAVPPLPALLAADDTGVAGDSKTSNRRPRLVGTATPGTTVELLDASNSVIATASASPTDGSYTLQTASNMAVGNYVLKVRVLNASGHASTSNGTLNFSVIDTTSADFNGDGKSDLGVFRQANSQWIVRYSGGAGILNNQYGAPNLADIPVTGDFDGSGKAVQAIFRPSTAEWFINSPSGQRIIAFGATNLIDIPVPGDYDGVGYTELAVFRPLTAQWFVLGPNGGHLLGVFGAAGNNDIPVPGDYDGSGKTEMAVYRMNTAQWFYQSATGGKLLGVFGAAGIDIPAPGDYDGVGYTELAVFRPSTAQWFVNSPGGGRLVDTYGAANYTDIPLETAAGFLKKVGIVPSGRSASLVRPAAEVAASAIIILPADSTSTPAAGVSAASLHHRPRLRRPWS